VAGATRAAVALTANALFSVAQPKGSRWLYLAGGTAVWAAAAALGVFLGFLFALPKTLQSDALGDASTRYVANTNLEQVSDWLTKILVGIGLVQLGRAPAKLSALAASLSPVFGRTGASGRYGLAICIYGIILGFLVAYLWTRARLISVLQSADVTDQIQDVLQDRDSANATAYSLVGRQLEDQAPVSQDELNAAVAAASPEWRTLIFKRAEDQRSQSWQADKPRMELTIPVFQALIAVDKEHAFFRHFGSYGYTLKDKVNPDYPGAVAALTEAIRIRGDAQTRGWPKYEWCRAVARIRSDSNFLQGNASPAAVQQAVHADLDVARRAGLSPSFFQPDGHGGDIDAVAAWLALNPHP